MFSVVIPLYNKEQFIAATIQSVLQQTYTDFEIIIVDNLSTDRSVSIVETFLFDKRVRLISQEERGVSATRNKGIEKATREIIAFLDADDLWHPRFLEQMSIAWTSNLELGAIASGIKRINAFETPDLVHFDDNLPFIYIENYFKDNHYIFTSSSVTVKKNVLEQCGKFDTRLTHGEDMDLWFRIMVENKGGYINEILSYYSFAPVVTEDKYGYLPAIRNHLVGNILEKYKSWLTGEKKSPDGFIAFVYQYCLSTLMAYYYRKDRKASNLILNQIPFKYKIKQPRNFLYFLPYSIGRKIYTSIS